MRPRPWSQRRAQLWRGIAQLRDGLAPLCARAGWALGDSATAIQPVIVGDNATALAVSAALEAQGISVGAIRPPTVAPGTARLRITLSASHGADDVRQLLAGLASAVATTEAAA